MDRLGHGFRPSRGVRSWLSLCRTRWRFSPPRIRSVSFRPCARFRSRRFRWAPQPGPYGSKERGIRGLDLTSRRRDHLRRRLRRSPPRGLVKIQTLPILLVYNLDPSPSACEVFLFPRTDMRFHISTVFDFFFSRADFSSSEILYDNILSCPVEAYAEMKNPIGYIVENREARIFEYSKLRQVVVRRTMRVPRSPYA